MSDLAALIEREQEDARLRRKLSLDEAQRLVTDYQAGTALKPLMDQYTISQPRLHRYLEAAGVQPRDARARMQLWQQSNQAHAQRDFMARPFTGSRPGRPRRAAQTPLARWTRREAICQRCGSGFALHAPPQVVERAYSLWQAKHPCQRGST